MKLLSILSLALFFAGANLSAHAGMMGGHGCPHKMHLLKARVFKQILVNNGVDSDTANAVLKDLMKVKVAIKHKIKNIIKDAIEDNDGDHRLLKAFALKRAMDKRDDDNDGHHRCPHRLKALLVKKILDKHGVDDKTARNILIDLKVLKMKIKHKIRQALREAKDDNDNDNGHDKLKALLKLKALKAIKDAREDDNDNGHDKLKGLLKLKVLKAMRDARAND